MNIAIDIEYDDVLLTCFSAKTESNYSAMTESSCIKCKITPEIETAIDAVIRLIEGEQE